MSALFEALRKAKDIAGWKVNVQTRESCELFYVQKKVETNRATDTVDYSVTVYVDEGEMRGQSSFTVYPYMDEGEIAKLIAENVFAAKFTLNKFFELPKPEPLEHPETTSNLGDKPFAEIIGDIGAAIMAANNLENSSLSATEIFLYKITRRVVNSNGVDVSSTSYECQIETIPNYVNGEEEVELYQAISFSVFDPKELTAKVDETLRLCRDRAHAIPMPKVDSIAIILQDEEAGQFFLPFVGDVDYRSVYMKANRFEIGQNIQEGRSGDPMTIEMRPFVKGCLASRAVDNDGVVLKPVTLIEDGVIKNRFGNYAYGFYLGVEHPTGDVPVGYVKEGTATFQDFKKAPYIRCVRFSGMQTDLMSGMFGGEVRLGYYFDGEKEIPVTGFSIQGNLLEAKNTFRASKERVAIERYSGPKYICIPNVKVN